MTTFERIQYYAKKRGMSLHELNDKAGLGTNAIYRWKKSKPSADRLQAVADALAVSSDYLLGKTDDPTPAQATSQKGPTQIDLKEKIDDESVIMTFEGRPIPKEDLEIIKRLLRRD